MKNFILKHHRLFFFTSWFLLNIIQAYATELFDDEAYYWIYSIFPAWGYYDHPPFIALFIRAGNALFPGELGVRLFIAIFNTASLYLIEKLIKQKNDSLFYAIACSLAVAQIGGIIAVPDLPLLFFVVLFFLAYRRYVSSITLWNALLLGISMACMLYSKYHGVLVILFTLLSNLRLLKNYQTYFAAVFAFLLFFPHIYWQYAHDFPSVQYHLFERNARSYQFTFTVEYILGQIALAGPVIGWLLLYAAFKKKSTSDTERALKFNLVGLYLFFLLSTYKGRVEANWTVPAFVALIVLSHQFLVHRQRLQKWVYVSVPITLALVFLLRAFMMQDREPLPWLSKDEFHGNHLWVEEVRQKANGLPVVFLDSYQRPSKYWFYSKQPSMALNTPTYRRNNFNFWPIEDSLLNRPAFVLSSYNNFFNQRMVVPYMMEYGARKIDRYYAFSRVQVKDIDARATENSISITAAVESPDNYLPFFQMPGMDTCKLYVSVLEPNVKPVYLSSGISVKTLVKAGQNVSFRVPVFNIPEGAVLKLGISSCLPGYPSLNSTSFKIN